MISTMLILTTLTINQGVPDQQADPLAAQAAQLVRQLDAPQLARREAAEAALTELGPDVLPFLPQITPQTPAEIRERLGRVTRILETAAAEAAIQPTTLTVSGTMTLEEFFETVEQQTGNRVAGYESRTGEIEVALEETPFWPAMDGVLDQANLAVNVFGGQPNALTLISRQEELRDRYGHATYSGIFRLEATRVEAIRDLRNPQLDTLRIHVEVSWEPRITPISLSHGLDSLEVTLEGDRPLSIASRGRDIELVARRDVSTVEYDLPLTLPSRDVDLIASVRGELIVTLPGNDHAFVFDDLPGADNVQQQMAGATVTLDQVRRNGPLFELRVRLQFDEAANALESHRGWVFNNDAYLLDPEGQRIEQAGLQTYRQGTNEVGIAYLFDAGDSLEGYRFVYETPAMIVRKAIPYELEDIRLP